MGTDHMTPAECRRFAKLAGELSVSGDALESCAATIARLEADLASAQQKLLHIRALVDTPVPRSVLGAPSPSMQLGMDLVAEQVRGALNS